VADECNGLDAGGFVALDVFVLPDVFVAEPVFDVLDEGPAAGGLFVVCDCENADEQKTPKLPASNSAPAAQ
jgi:hypothetical protein